MPEPKLRVAVIIGSTRNGRFGPTPAGWIAAEAAKRDDLDIDVIDLAKVWLPDVLPADEHAERPAAVQDLAPWLSRADAFVVVTPEYNHSFPASLKNAIDWYVDEWKAKPVAFVSYGGIAGGLRSVAHLREIFPGLHAVTVRDSVAFPEYWNRFDDDGRPTHATECEAAAKTMLDQLTWWGRTLRAARAEHPYPG
ncbi:NADPH-dependent FMN reductase [Streptomyces luteolus]|uniref:NAD(P)H-dependent oxidoreductase n=1 Tax=Streptomyces luteolus TaxID=3043615 RepID=A0ABT6T5J9_9ACTN|nr:NAD(P)H-dependent oxidoreductase [Streptomyces sp. B-S-A12]MDI3422915.1 NAD(P)H-dependent oxidoreductase [Streptomyces sp. B-S-A12]